MERRDVRILYGSETGNSVDVSDRIAHELKRKHFKVSMSSMDEFEMNSIPQQNIMIFVASTTGQGDTPNNMKKFWRFLLRKNLPQNCLSHIWFTVFGLGDSSYPKYNVVGRRIYQRLLNLGANSIHPRGLGDDQHNFGFDAAFMPWLQSFSQSIEQKYGIPPDCDVLPLDSLPPPRYKAHLYSQSQIDSMRDHDDFTVQKGVFGVGSAVYTPIRSRVLRHVRMTPLQHWQDVRHLSLDLRDCQSNTVLSYEPGDVLLLHPNNPMESVAKMCSIAGFQIDEAKNTYIRVENIDDCAPNLGLPSVITVYELFQSYLDICGIPRRTFFERLIHFTKDETHIAKLKEFSSIEGQLALFEYNQLESRSYIEVLGDFNSCTIAMDYLLSYIPKLKPRKFSISSAMQYYFDKRNRIDNHISIQSKPSIVESKSDDDDTELPINIAEITVALVEYETPLKRKRNGLCSQFIDSLRIIDDSTETAIQTTVPIWIEKGSFRYPKNWELSPLICIGPGTGIAPFRAMSQYRYYCNCHSTHGDKPSSQMGSVLVFFGNRNETNDFFFSNEWRKLENAKTVHKLVTAFSRDQPSKIYVTHRMMENGALIWDWLANKNAFLFVAGSSLKMPQNVRKSLVGIASEFGKLNSEQSEAFVKKLETTYRYQSETWS